MTTLQPCQYKTGKKLGQGSYAIVKEAFHIQTGQVFAVKVINKSLMKGHEYLILNEIETLKTLSKQHAHIVTLHDYFETPNNLYLVMDLCQGGELFDRLASCGSFFERDAAKLIHDIVDAVRFLHQKNLVHRDIKPENILFKEKDNLNSLVLADFGLSKLMSQDILLRTRCGTPGYMAPEIQKGQYGKPVDMWSIGVMAFFLLSGFFPFDSNSSIEEMSNIIQLGHLFEPVPVWTDISQMAKDFILGLLNVHPEQRLTAEQAIHHEWLRAHTPKETQPNLLPNVKEQFNAKKTLKRAMHVVRAIQRKKDAAKLIEPVINTDLLPQEGPEDLLLAKQT